MMTKIDEKRHFTDIVKNFKRWEIRLIELRNEGFGYNECRDVLQKEFPKLKKYFKTNNQLRNLMFRRLKEATKVYGEIAAQDSLGVGRQVVKNAHRRAAMTMVSLLGTNYPDSIRLSAAKDILDRNAGKATQAIEVKSEEETEMEELREIVKKMTEPNEDTFRIREAIGKKAKSQN